MIKTALRLAAFSLFLASGAASKKAKKEKIEAPDTSLCDKSLPSLSVSDVVLDQRSFLRFKKENKLFVLGISDSSCKHCC